MCVLGNPGGAVASCLSSCFNKAVRSLGPWTLDRSKGQSPGGRRHRYSFRGSTVVHVADQDQTKLHFEGNSDTYPLSGSSALTVNKGFWFSTEVCSSPGRKTSGEYALSQALCQHQTRKQEQDCVSLPSRTFTVSKSSPGPFSSPCIPSPCLIMEFY